VNLRYNLFKTPHNDCAQISPNYKAKQKARENSCLEPVYSGGGLARIFWQFSLEISIGFLLFTLNFLQNFMSFPFPSIQFVKFSFKNLGLSGLSHTLPYYTLAFCSALN
jgi:hypothetical protein